MKNTNFQSANNKSFSQMMRDKLKIGNGKFFTRLQFLGRAMVFPVIVLPLAALFLRIGSLMSDTTIPNIVEGNAIWYIGQVLSNIGAPIFANLPLVFAIGLAFGLSKGSRGEAALAGAVALLVLRALMAENVLPSAMWNNVEIYHSTSPLDPLYAVDGKSLLLYTVKNNTPFFGLDLGVLGGIVAGCMTAYIYNHYAEIKLPQSLAFFEGKRFVPLASIIIMIPFAVVFSVIWPWIQLGLTNVGLWAVKGGWIGTLIYSFLKTILVLVGLHQIINTFLWFQLPITGEAMFTNGGFIAGQTYTVNGDINAFMDGIVGSGVFLTGSFPEIMGGYWGIAIAIILTAKKANRKNVKSLMLSVCLVCSLTGVGEPLVLPLWYAAPLIYFIQAVLNAVFGAAAVAMGIRMGFGFSAGWVDYCVSFWTSWRMSFHSSTGSVLSNPLWLILLAIINGGLFYVVFYFVIIKCDLKTMGREDIDLSMIQSEKSESKNDKYFNLAEQIAKIVGIENVVKIDNCATRLRLEVKSNKEINVDDFKRLMIPGAKKIGDNNLQIIIGNGVEAVKDNFESIINREKQKRDGTEAGVLNEKIN